MQALLVIDAQNEFSEKGLRPVPNFNSAVAAIIKRVKLAREQGTPIAWVRHFNKPHESPGFREGTWGAEFADGLGADPKSKIEIFFTKNVYGCFTGTAIGAWIEELGIDEVLLVGFYAHACISTTSREAIMADLKVVLDPEATGSCDIFHEALGHMTADEIRRAALLQLVNMGASIVGHQPTQAHSQQQYQQAN